MQHLLVSDRALPQAGARGLPSRVRVGSFAGFYSCRGGGVNRFLERL